VICVLNVQSLFDTQLCSLVEDEKRDMVICVLNVQSLFDTQLCCL